MYVGYPETLLRFRLQREGTEIARPSLVPSGPPSSRASARFVRLLVISHRMFEMCATIENPASCEVRSVITFLSAINHKSIEIFRRLCEVYGKNIIIEGGLRQRCIKFKNGRINIHDERRSGGETIEHCDSSVVTKFDNKIRENCRFTVMEFSLSFPQISCSLLHEIIRKNNSEQK